MIFGTSTLARLATYYATRELGFNVVAFVIDGQYLDKRVFLQRPILTWNEFLAAFSAHTTFVYSAVGYKSMRSRAVIFERFKANGYELMNIVSPYAYVADDVTLGENNFLMPGVVLETGVTLDSNNVIWSNTTVCHDTSIGNHNFIAANSTLGGGVKIGNANFLGFSTIVLENLRIGDEVLIGAGSLIRSDTKDLTKVLGAPAKAVEDIESNLGIRIQ